MQGYLKVLGVLLTIENPAERIIQFGNDFHKI